MTAVATHKTWHLRWAGLITLAALAALGGAVLSGLVPQLGRYIPQSSIASDYMRGVLWAACIALSILAWPLAHRDRPVVLGLWVAKSICVLGPMLLYEAFYRELDIYLYFSEANRNAVYAPSVGFANGTETVIAVARAFTIVAGDSFHALKTMFAAVGLIGLYLFYRAAVMAWGRERPVLFVVFALTPTMLFWSSILGKEPLILLGLGVHAYGVVRWVRLQRVSGLLIAFAGSALCSLIRLWMGVIVVFPLLWLVLRSQQSWRKRVLIGIPCGLALAVGVATFREMFAVETVTDLMTAANSVSRAWAYGGSAQQASELTSVGGLVSFLPIAAFTALFRPLPLEVRNPFGLVAGIENVLLLGLCLVALWRLRRPALGNVLVQWLLLLIVLWASVYGLISYQNLGAAVRFKMQILPFMMLLVAVLIERLPTNPDISGKPAQFSYGASGAR